LGRERRSKKKVLFDIVKMKVRSNKNAKKHNHKLVHVSTKVKWCRLVQVVHCVVDESGWGKINK